MATMARDSINKSVVIKTLIVEIFYEPGHSQNHDTRSPNTPTELFCIALFIIPLEQVAAYWPFVHYSVNNPTLIIDPAYWIGGGFWKYIGRYCLRFETASTMPITPRKSAAATYNGEGCRRCVGPCGSADTVYSLSANPDSANLFASEQVIINPCCVTSRWTIVRNSMDRIMQATR
jgi:hypothetical protein